jgi:hypothetical protein
MAFMTRLASGFPTTTPSLLLPAFVHRRWITRRRTRRIARVRLLANSEYVVHEFRDYGGIVRTDEFEIPAGAIGADGQLLLTWEFHEANHEGPA